MTPVSATTIVGVNGGSMPKSSNTTSIDPATCTSSPTRRAVIVTSTSWGSALEERKLRAGHVATNPRSRSSVPLPNQVSKMLTVYTSTVAETRLDTAGSAGP